MTRVLLWPFAALLWLVGAVAALLVVVALWIAAAVAVGFDDVRAAAAAKGDADAD